MSLHRKPGTDLACIAVVALLGCSTVPNDSCTPSRVVVEDTGVAVTSGTLLLNEPAGGECAGDSQGTTALNRQGVLTAPGFVQASILPDGGGVELNWIDANTDEDGYLVQRRQAGFSQWAIINIYPPDTSSAVDELRAESISYYYRVVAFQEGVTRAAPEVRVDFPDETPPDTQLLFKPPTLTADNRATFVFVSSEGSGRFTCLLGKDDADPTPVSCGEDLNCLLGDARCRGSWTGTSLGTGTWTFVVAARDLAGNEDPTPAKYTWEIDRSPPVLSVTPPPPVKVFASDTITINFNSDDPDAEYWCTVVTAGDALPPIGPKRCDPATGFSFPYGADGVQRTFSVSATDPLGNTGAPATHSFSIDRTPPTITFVAPTTTYLQPASELTVAVVLTDPGTDVLDAATLFPTGFTEVPARCWLFSANAGVNQLIDPCLTGLSKGVQLNITLNGLPVTDGDFSLAVTVEDVLGNAGAATFDWHFDGFPPVPTFTRTPTDPTSPPASFGDPVTVRTSVAVYDWQGTNPQHSAASTAPAERERVRAWYCSFDEPGANNMAAVPCTPPLVITGITPSPPGGWTLSVTGVDLAGNVSAPLTHNLHVTYDPYSTTLADAAGPAIRFTTFAGLKGPRATACVGIPDGTLYPIDPFSDPHFLGVVSGFGSAAADVLAMYSPPSTRDVLGRPRGNTINESPYYVNSVSATPAGVLTTNVNVADDQLRTDCESGPWSLQVSLRDSGNRPNPAAPALALAHLGMAAPSVDHVLLRAAHPQYGWVMRGGEPWQATVKVDRRLSTTPATWVIAIDVPPVRENIDAVAIQDYLAEPHETLASRVVSESDFLITRDHEGYLDIVGEAPHCSGMVQIRVETWAGGQHYGDFVRLPVSTPASGADSREPDDSWAQRLGPLSVTGGLDLMNRTLTSNDADFVGLGLDYGRPLTVEVNEPTLTGTPIWLGIYENGSLVQQVSDTDGSLTIGGFMPAAGNQYGVEISAGTVTGCLRYYLHVTQ